MTHMAKFGAPNAYTMDMVLEFSKMNRRFAHVGVAYILHSIWNEATTADILHTPLAAQQNRATVISHWA